MSPGGDGDDYLHPGLGNDALDGGSDRDFVTFFAQSGPVEANLSTGSATGEDVGTDTPAWLEGLQGTDHDDDLTGDDGNNLLWAGYGEDRISGLGRNDDLDGGADELDLSRPNNRHLAFGAGLHYCIGAHLVRLELRMLLSELTRRVRMVEQTGAAVPNHSIIDLDLESLPLKLYPG